MLGAVSGLVCSCVLLAAFGERLFAQGLDRDLCKNENPRRYLSPDRQVELVVFDRDCGATTGFSTQASVVAPGEGLADGPGNLCALDDDHGRAATGPTGGPVLKVRWTGPRSVVLSHAVAARLFIGSPDPTGLQVSFDTF